MKQSKIENQKSRFLQDKKTENKNKFNKLSFYSIFLQKTKKNIPVIPQVKLDHITSTQILSNKKKLHQYR